MFLDISKAFDRVLHKGILFKLRQLGVNESLINLFSSYLKNRSQIVRVNGVNSDVGYTNCGVPQGSVLGPLLFLVYIFDISDNICSNISLFADDTILFDSCKCPTLLHTTISKDLVKLEHWAKLWFINFNPDKSKVMTISSKPSSHPPFRFVNAFLTEVESHKHLGLFFHRSLSWHCHISYLHNKVSSRINALRKLVNSVPRYILYTLYRTCKLPLLDYGDIIVCVINL